MPLSLGWLQINQVRKPLNPEYLADGKERKVFSFMIQDGTDSIKCNCWGGMTIHGNCFGIGDIVQVEYPDIKSKKITNWATLSTSDYDIHMSEVNPNSNIRVIVQGQDNFDYLFRPLSPVINQIQSLNSLIDQSVNLCVAVGKICGTITCKGKNGDVSRTKLRLFDRTDQLTLIMWGEETEAILPKINEGKTILYLNSVRISRYQGELQASTGFNSTVILNPCLPYAQELEHWLKNPTQNRKITEYFSQLPAPAMKVKPVDIDRQFTIGKLKEVYLEENTECFGFFEAAMCRFDLFGENSHYLGCKNCRKKLVDGKCNCPEQVEKFFFSAEADFIDSTGKIVALRLFDDIVAALIHKSADDFYSLPRAHSEIIASQVNWKVCKVCFKMTLGPNKLAKYSVLECESESVEE